MMLGGVRQAIERGAGSLRSIVLGRPAGGHYMTEMARHVRTTIRFDGPALATHEMDVQDLAPALLALADIIQAANQKFNGDHANIKVLVNADVEQRCFMLDLSLVQSLMERAHGFFGSDDVKTAKDIAEWIGLIGGGAITTGAGLFGLLRLLARQKDAQAPFTIEQSGDGNIIVAGNGNSVIVTKQTYLLAQDPRIVEKAKSVVRPLQKPGYETLSFLEGDFEVLTIDEIEAADIVALPPLPLTEMPTESSSDIHGSVRIKSPQYEGTAQWSFLWNGRAISADMVDRAAEWVADFQANKIGAPPNTVLEVSMSETVRLDGQGFAVGKPAYKVYDVHSVTPPPKQGGLFDLT